MEMCRLRRVLRWKIQVIIKKPKTVTWTYICHGNLGHNINMNHVYTEWAQSGAKGPVCQPGLDESPSPFTQDARPGTCLRARHGQGRITIDTASG